VKDLAEAQDRDGNFIHNEKPGRWFLKEAHKQVMSGIGRGASCGDDDVHDADREERSSRANFARLDDFRGLDLEDEVANLTPEEQERWLRAG
jgi:hypothetical protein